MTTTQTTADFARIADEVNDNNFRGNQGYLTYDLDDPSVEASYVHSPYPNVSADRLVITLTGDARTRVSARDIKDAFLRQRTYGLAGRCSECGTFDLIHDCEQDTTRTDTSRVGDMVPTISTNDVINDLLPADLTGVHWVDTGWTECLDHLRDPSWAAQITGTDDETGVALHGEVECDACREAQ